MTVGPRPRLLYLVPGHVFLPSAGPTRNVLNQARAMSAWADVTLAFREVVDPPGREDPPVLEIDPHPGGVRPGVDDAGTRGMGYRAFLGYLRAVRRLLEARAGDVDVVLEKDWMLTGYAAWWCRRLGTPCVPVKNWVAGSRRDPVAAPGKRIRQAVGAALEGWFLRRSPCVVVETAYLRSAVVSRWGLDPGRIEVIGLGVDRTLFRPSEPAEARRRIGVSPEATMLLYVGILDRTHDLEPLLRALVGLRSSGVQLHVVGDGPRLSEYEAMTRDASESVVFHGRVPHAEVPDWIAAADLCVAPYDPSSFPEGEVAYSTLKIREYLSAGRAVATVNSGSLRDLVEDDITGFLRENRVESWQELLRTRLERDRLRRMGSAAAAARLESWQDVSLAFERLCRRQLASGTCEAGPAGDVRTCEVGGG